MILKEPLHRLAHSLVVENYGSPRRTGNHWIEQGDHAALIVKYRELHREGIRHTNFNARGLIILKTLSVLVIQRSLL